MKGLSILCVVGVIRALTLQDSYSQEEFVKGSDAKNTNVDSNSNPTIYEAARPSLKMANRQRRKDCPIRYYRVPRTGSSSMKRPLLACNGVEYFFHEEAMRDAIADNHSMCGNSVVRTIVTLRDPCDRFQSAYKHAVTKYAWFRSRHPSISTLIQELQKDYPGGFPYHPHGEASEKDVIKLLPLSTHNVVFWPTSFFFNAKTKHPVCFHDKPPYEQLQNITQSYGCAESDEGWERAMQSAPTTYSADVLKIADMSKEDCAAVKNLYHEDVKLWERHCVQ